MDALAGCPAGRFSPTAYSDLVRWLARAHPAGTESLRRIEAVGREAGGTRAEGRARWLPFSPAEALAVTSPPRLPAAGHRGKRRGFPTCCLGKLPPTARPFTRISRRLGTPPRTDRRPAGNLEPGFRLEGFWSRGSGRGRLRDHRDQADRRTLLRRIPRVRSWLARRRAWSRTALELLLGESADRFPPGHVAVERDPEDRRERPLTRRPQPGRAPRRRSGSRRRYPTRSRALPRRRSAAWPAGSRPERQCRRSRWCRRSARPSGSLTRLAQRLIVLIGLVPSRAMTGTARKVRMPQAALARPPTIAPAIPKRPESPG